jgi:hypothetical protein
VGGNFGAKLSTISHSGTSWCSGKLIGFLTETSSSRPVLPFRICKILQFYFYFLKKEHQIKIHFYENFAGVEVHDSTIFILTMGNF